MEPSVVRDTHSIITATAQRDQTTASATSSTEAGMLKPPVLPQLNGGNSPASMESETTTMTPKPSVPPQPVRDHYSTSTEAVTAAVMITVGFQYVWDFIRKHSHV
jgi:hypothetical protein